MGRDGQKGRAPVIFLDKNLDDPVEVARLFTAGLLTPVEALPLLEFLVAPETREKWGDFTPTSESIKSEGFAGIWAKETYALGDRTVAYVPLLSSSDMGKVESGPAIVLANLSLVWREDLDRWIVFALGESAPPEVAPRGT